MSHDLGYERTIELKWPSVDPASWFLTYYNLRKWTCSVEPSPPAFCPLCAKLCHSVSTAPPTSAYLTGNLLGAWRAQNGVGPVRWLPRQIPLPPLTARVQSLGPTRWQEKTCPCRLSSSFFMHIMAHMHFSHIIGHLWLKTHS